MLQIVTNFLGGQVSGDLRGRIETELYRKAALLVRNATLALTGGAYSRPGTIRRVTQGNANDYRIETVIIRRDLAFIMAISEANIKVYQIGATLTEIANIAAPWADAAVYTMTYTQVGRIVVFCDRSFWPQRLTFSDDGSSAALANWAFETNLDGTTAEPLFKTEAEEVTLNPAAATGTGVTVIASAPTFVAGDVGRAISIREGRGTIASYVSATEVTVDWVRDVQQVLDPNPFHKREGITTEIEVTALKHGLSPGDEVTFSNAGIITGVTSGAINTTHTVSSTPTADTFVIPVTTSDITTDFGGAGVEMVTSAATRRWRLGVFGTVANPNPPQAVARHQGRLWFGGTSLGDDRWGSQAGNIFNFDEGDGSDTDAIVAIGDTEFFFIRHLVSGNEVLEVFGDNRLAIMFATGAALSPTDKQSVIVPGQQGSGFQRPLNHDGARIYVDALGQHVRELIPFPDDKFQYRTTPLTVASPDILNEPITAFRFEGDAQDTTAWSVFVNGGDNSMACFVSQREEGTAGWFRWESDGEILSACAAGERMFICERRDTEVTINEVDFTRIALADRSENLTAGAPTTSWTAPAFFRGKQCDIIDANGRIVAEVVPDASTGGFETPIELDDLWIGLPVEWRVELLPALAEYRSGIRQGKRERIVRAFVDFQDTVAACVMNRILRRYDPADVTAPPVVFSGQREIRILGRQRSPQFSACGKISEKAALLKVMLEMSDV